MSSSPVVTQLTNEGLTVSRLTDRYLQLVAALQSTFGPDINVDPNALDGQLVGILAESINNLDSVAEAVYQSFNPQTAAGAPLSRLVQLNGITRSPGAYSTVALTCTGTAGTTVPAGFLVRSEDGSATWETTADATIDSGGSTVVQAQATVMGPLTASIGTVTVPVTPVYGVQSVTNLSAAVPGAYEETDAALRIRRAASTSIGSSGPLDAIRGSLLNQSGVTQARVYENNTDAVDDNGQPPHSIYAIVQGGDDQVVANVIWFKKSAGVGIVGSVEKTVVDTAGFPHTIKFDRPAASPIYFVVNVKKRAGYPENGAALIKSALVSYGQSACTIGQPVIQSEFYAPLLAAVPSASILSLCIGLTASPTGTVDLTIPYNHIATFDPSYIVVNES